MTRSPRTAHAPRPALLRLAAAAAALLCGRPAAADILPSEAFISPTPVPWDRRDPDAHTRNANPGGEPVPDDREDVALQSVTASLDLFPTVAIVRASALLHGPAGELRRVGIPQFTQWVRAAPLGEFAVRIDGRPVAPELIQGTSAPPIADRPRRSDDWWVWPVEFTAAPVRIDMDYTQALSEPERTNDRMRELGFHVVGDGALWRGPIRSIEFSLHLHGIDRDSVTTPIAPTSITADGFTWSLKNVEIADSSPGAVIDMPVASLPGRDVVRAPYFPADAPAHLVLHDYVARFAVQAVARGRGARIRLTAAADARATAVVLGEVLDPRILPAGGREPPRMAADRAVVRRVRGPRHQRRPRPVDP